MEQIHTRMFCFLSNNFYLCLNEHSGVPFGIRRIAYEAEIIPIDLKQIMLP